MELPKPMSIEECDEVASCEASYMDCHANTVARVQHQRDLAWFVALLRKRAKVPRGFADGFIDAYSLADELEQEANAGSTS